MSAQNDTSQQSQLVKTVVEVAKAAFDPATEPSVRERGLIEYKQLVESADTWSLLSALNSVIKPGILPHWLRQPLLETLTLLPLRRDGVRATLEFVFSVHPSNQNAAPSGPQKAGAEITHEAVAVATRLLSLIPETLTPQAWFEGISGQLFDLMDGNDGPELAKTAAQVVGFGILGRKQYGAPGSPGWTAFVHPLLKQINPSLLADADGNLPSLDDSDGSDSITTLTATKTLVASQTLAESLSRLSMLILSNPSPGLCKRVLTPVLPQLWAIASWDAVSPTVGEQLVDKSRVLVQTYMRLFGTLSNLQPILKHLCQTGSDEHIKPPWAFTYSNEGIRIDRQSDVSSLHGKIDVEGLENKSELFASLLVAQVSTDEISNVFLSLLQTWIRASQRGHEIQLTLHTESSQPNSALYDLVAVAILQKLMDKAPEKLVGHFAQLLELITAVLKADAASALEDDITSVILSLLNLVITAPSFDKSDMTPVDLELIEESLDRLSAEDRPEVAGTARNLAMLLRYHDELENDTDKTSQPSIQQLEDRRTYNLAMSYITGAGDNPPPVVSEGLDLLSNLIRANSSVLDITAVITLMARLLLENEDYINLRVIKVFTQLADRHPKATTKEVLDRYLDAAEKLSTDVRLRFGEALLQVVEKLGLSFTGDVAQLIGETLLSIGGRRGNRPKTMAKQVRDEKRRAMKQEQGEEDMLQDDEGLSEDERQKNDILAQILLGWESKRGAEDVRMRTSALSIFGTCLEVNIAGMGASLVSSSIDLCINILSLEPEPEKAILRRASIIVVHNFVKALDEARSRKRSLGFGLTYESREDITRTLEYIAQVDNDGLVQQHARDVVESLEAWQMRGLLPGSDSSPQQDTQPGMSRLAGLVVNPVTQISGDLGGGRPKIEELD